jgi:hypothetical protein
MYFVHLFTSMLLATSTCSWMMHKLCIQCRAR